MTPRTERDSKCDEALDARDREFDHCAKDAHPWEVPPWERLKSVERPPSFLRRTGWGKR